MEASKLHSGPFRRNAFIWPSTFSQRQTNSYPKENRHQVKRLLRAPEGFGTETTSIGVSDDDVEEWFIKDGSQHDSDRFLFRKLQIGSFLRAAKIEILRGPPQRSLSKPMALLDDRNNASVTRLQQAGSCRPFRGPLTAQELFIDLSQEVR